MSAIGEMTNPTSLNATTSTRAVVGEFKRGAFVVAPVHSRHSTGKLLAGKNPPLIALRT
jgi:hypothetical protein